MTSERTKRMKQAQRELLAENVKNAQRMAWLEKYFKKNRRLWGMVSIETVGPGPLIEACNKNHGDAAGRYVGRTFAEAVDKAMEGRK